MAISIKGKIIHIGETETFASGFSKREIVIEELVDQYPQKLKSEFVKDKCSILDHYKLNEEVEISVNLRGSEYQGKYYVGLQAWKIERLNGATASSSSQQSSSSVSNAQSEVDDDGDRLPL